MPDLDFTKLNNLGRRSSQNSDTASRINGNSAVSSAPKEPLRSDYRGSENDKADISLRAEQENVARMKEAYRTYQTNIQKSGQLQSEIINGIHAGEYPQFLLLKACKAISLMTGNELFYSTVFENMKTIYGSIFGDPIPLQWELEEVQDRLHRIEKTLENESLPEADRKRLKKAAEVHRKKEAEISGQLEDKKIRIE